MADMSQQFQNLFSNANGGRNTQGPVHVADTSEQVYISSLALLKMLKHGRAGVPMEVMGLMLGDFIDDYTIRVVDVFSMPQSGTAGQRAGNSVSVEAVDPVYQTEMKDQLKRTGRPEVVVGWYHSHPGFGCWFSGTDVNTQQSFEQLNPRAVGVVIDPIQSVKGKVVIDCFRLISPHMLMLGQEPRQTTSNVGHLQKPTIIALVHGLNRNYYSIVINCKKSPLESQMLLNFNKNRWTKDLHIPVSAAQRAGLRGDPEGKQQAGEGDQGAVRKVQLRNQARDAVDARPAAGLERGKDRREEAHRKQRRHAPREQHAEHIQHNDGRGHAVAPGGRALA